MENVQLKKNSINFTNNSISKIIKLLFSNRNLIFKKIIAFVALLFLIYFGHLYAQGIFNSENGLIPDGKIPFLNCEVIRIRTNNYIQIKDEKNEVFYLELTKPFMKIKVKAGDKISFIGKITGKKEEKRIVVNIVENFYNHRLNKLKRIISIPPVLIIFYFLFKKRKEYFS